MKNHLRFLELTSLVIGIKYPRLLKLDEIGKLLSYMLIMHNNNCCLLQGWHLCQALAQDHNQYQRGALQCIKEMSTRSSVNRGQIQISFAKFSRKFPMNCIKLVVAHHYSAKHVSQKGNVRFANLGHASVILTNEVRSVFYRWKFCVRMLHRAESVNGKENCLM